MISVPKKSILLVVPPFQTTARPALGVSQLKANLQEQGFSAGILYSHFSFAERIGLDLYEWIFGSTFNTLAGEFIFSGVLFHHSDDAIELFMKRVLKGTNEEDYFTRQFPDRSIPQVLRWLMQEASSYCEEAVGEIVSCDPWMVGFTSSFQQNCSSLALVRLLKRRRPDILTVMGGANCLKEMGEELIKQFPEIDYMGQGECDHSFVNLVQSLKEGDNALTIPGILTRSKGNGTMAPQPLTAEELDRLPYPDFSDYFTQLKELNVAHRILPALLMETARGCWWGAKQHCTFCAFNGTELTFRSKSPSRALDELTALVNQYGVQRVAMTDNILDLKYFKSFLPRLADHPIVGIFYETKANLTRPQVRLLAQSRVDAINPGMESLSDEALRLLKKGTTKIQNIQLLKWCAEFGIWVGWNYLYGVPGEREEELFELARDTQMIHHLQQPAHTMSIRVERSSPYFNDPGTYGLEPLSPAEPYRHIYPFSEESLNRIAYCFSSEAFSSVAGSSAFMTLKDIVAAWENAYQRSYLLAIHRKNSLIIIDTRPCREKSWHRLSGIRRRVYGFCEKGRTVDKIRSAMDTVSDGDLDSILDSFVRAKLMIHSGGRYLSLAVNARPNCGKLGNIASGGYVIPANGPRRLRQNILRALTFKIPPGKIAAAVERRASIVKTKILNKTIFYLTHFLSRNGTDKSIKKECQT